MHELGVTQELLDLALTHATRARGSRVTSLHLAIGDLSTFCEDAVSFCWDHLARGTLCEGAQLRFRRVAAEVTCQSCGRVRTGALDPEPCAHCGSSRLRVTAGDDLILESLEIETGSSSPAH